MPLAIPSALKFSRSPKIISLPMNIFWALVGNAGYAGFTWLILIALTKLGSVSEVGLFGIAQAVALPIQMFFTFKLRTVQITDSSTSFNAADYLGIRVYAAVVNVIVSTSIALVFYPSEVVLVVCIQSISYGIMIIREMYQAVLQKCQRLDLVALSNIANGLFCCIAFVCAYSFHRVLWMALAWMTVTRFSLLYLVDRWLCCFLLREEKFLSFRYFTSKDYYKRLIKLLKIGVPLGGVALIGTLFLSVPRVVLERMHGLDSVGYYAAMSSTIVILNMLTTSFGQAFIPILAKLNATDKKGFLRLFAQYLIINTILFIVCIIVVNLHGPSILSILFNQDYARYSTEFTLLISAGGILSIFSAMNTGLSAQQSFAVQFPIYLVCATAIVIAALLLIPSQSIAGAAWASIVCYCVGVILCSVKFAINVFKNGKRHGTI
ncbi:MAG: oligosaccharide flippase family protein [Desulfobacteraceae bacterium]|nr:oligosaccharide flippase family protein [Desulfobacteraceae bacterium]